MAATDNVVITECITSSKTATAPADGLKTSMLPTFRRIESDPRRSRTSSPFGWRSGSNSPDGRRSRYLWSEIIDSGGQGNGSSAGGSAGGSFGGGLNPSLQAILRGMTETRQTLTDVLTGDKYFKKRLMGKLRKGPKQDTGHSVNPRPSSPAAEKSKLFSRRSEAETSIDTHHSQSPMSSYSQPKGKHMRKRSEQYEDNMFQQAVRSLGGLRYVVVSVTRFGTPAFQRA